MADSDWAQYKQLRGKTLPPAITFRDDQYELVQIFKRDFYAVTGFYRLKDGVESSNCPNEVVLKIYHTEPLSFIPLRWMGRMLCDREVYFYEQTTGIAGLPKFLGRFGESGFVREYIPGWHLREYRKKAKPDLRFYAKIYKILSDLHNRGIAHNDLSKAENILVRFDGTPVLIDLQIAISSRFRFPLLRWLGAKILPYMQSVDRYHIGKHHRKDRPEDFTPEELAKSRRKGVLLNLHAWLLRKPYRAMRHFVMGNFMKVSSSAAGMESSHSRSEIPPAKAA
jgi:serine/threonine protein kinase